MEKVVVETIEVRATLLAHDPFAPRQSGLRDVAASGDVPQITLPIWAISLEIASNRQSFLLQYIFGQTSQIVGQAQMRTIQLGSLDPCSS